MKNKIKTAIAEKIQQNRRRILDWQLTHEKEAPPPFYCSVDLRDSGHKIVPVDSNLFPAGFNNICPEDLRTAPQIFRQQLERATRPGPQKIVILPESHTQNSNYIENLYYLSQIIQNGGMEVRVGWFGPLPAGSESEAVLHLQSATGKTVEAFPIQVEDNGRMTLPGFVPDAVLLNNDFSGGHPEALDRVLQPILPSHRLGWHSRKKSDHFVHYNELAREFASLIDLDPWHIQVDTREVSQVDFNEGVGIEEVAQVTERMLESMRADYELHKVNRKPFVFIKNNAGTYGMGIMTAHTGDEIRSMNRRTKNKMSVGKNKKHIDSVVVQEGIPTATLVDRLAAEPVIYLMGSELIGGFLRTNTERGDDENLNSSGMVFRKLCMSDLRKLDEADAEDEATPAKDAPTLELVYGSIAKISALAAGREFKAGQRAKAS